jgi:hypothetical protein
MSNPSFFAPSYSFEPAVERSAERCAPSGVASDKPQLSIWLELAAVPLIGTAAVLPVTGEFVQALPAAALWFVIAPCALALVVMIARRP